MPQTFRRRNPRYPKWRELKCSLDLDNRFRSVLAQRLRMPQPYSMRGADRRSPLLPSPAPRRANSPSAVSRCYSARDAALRERFETEFSTPYALVLGAGRLGDAQLTRRGETETEGPQLVKFTRTALQPLNRFARSALEERRVGFLIYLLSTLLGRCAPEIGAPLVGAIRP